MAYHNLTHSDACFPSNSNFYTSVRNVLDTAYLYCNSVLLHSIIPCPCDFMCMQNVSICQCLLLTVICFFVTKLEIWIDSSSCLVTWHWHVHLGWLSALSHGYYSTRVDIGTSGTALSLNIAVTRVDISTCMPHYPFSKQMWWSFHERNQSSSSPGHEG